ncbi:MAG TPA: hypothetical protein PLB32_12230, partial [Acidobacteriota bacterium]|nr:hypothetical protein [Acidobacteriota bacterium]
MFLNKSLLRIGAIAAAICGLGGAALCFISPSLGGALIGLGVALGGGSFWALADLLAQQEETYQTPKTLSSSLAAPNAPSYESSPVKLPTASQAPMPAPPVSSPVTPGARPPMPPPPAPTPAPQVLMPPPPAPAPQAFT